MPAKPLKACATPLCPELTTERFCAACAAERQTTYDQARAADHKFYATRAWRKLRLRILDRDPFCKQCEREGEITASTTVDHIQRRRWRPDLALEPKNLEGLCESCHNAKTASETRGS